jgi:hypothetical protein
MRSEADSASSLLDLNPDAKRGGKGHPFFRNSQLDWAETEEILRRVHETIDHVPRIAGRV